MSRPRNIQCKWLYVCGSPSHVGSKTYWSVLKPSWCYSILKPSEFMDSSLHFIPKRMMTSSNENIFRVTGPLCGEFTGPGDSPHKGQWRGAFMFTLICVWISGWVNNHEAGDLRRYRVHYDAIVMRMAHFFTSPLGSCHANETGDDDVALPGDVTS